MRLPSEPRVEDVHQPMQGWRVVGLPQLGPTARWSRLEGGGSPHVRTRQPKEYLHQSMPPRIVGTAGVLAIPGVEIAPDRRLNALHEPAPEHVFCDGALPQRGAFAF